MLEVNQEWANQVDPQGILLDNWQFSNDDQRIQMHLMLVEHFLRARPTDHLTPSQQENRLHQLDVLREYWLAGKFPRNIYHSVRQPYFVDFQGTACAVGHLAQQSGEKDLVAQISKENNYAYVRELKYPGLLAWAENNGLTAEELAWIQPGYPPAFRAFQKIGNGGGVTGHINKMVTSEDGETLYIGGLFSSIDDVNAGSVIAWDGTDWISLGNGVNGEIYDMEFWNNHLYVVGDFQLVDDPNSHNIAYFDGTSWVGLQQGDMQGKVLALQSRGSGRLFIGGDFQTINGEEMPYLARLENGTWTNSSRVYVGNGYLDVPGAMSVNAPVHCLEFINNRLLVGGDFTETAPGVDVSEVNPLDDVNYLAYWDANTWAGGLYGTHPPVRAIGVNQGDLFIGSEGFGEFEEISLTVLRAGLWESFYGFSTFDFTNAGIRDFLPMDEHLMILGSFYYSPGVGTTGTGAALMNSEYLGGEGYAYFNGGVNSAVEFKNNLIFAGDFDAVNGELYSGIVQLSTVVNSIPELGAQLDISTFLQDGQLTIRYSGLQADANLRLLNLNGQMLKQTTLEGTSGESQLWVGQFPAGTYVYQLQSGKSLQSGKFVKPY
ncbi:MAG: hypothetical protein DHS20C18_40950 [Saprospiraceae bacterium]|nr:MAG: hypothetical protein DHS20C18_40950 [Saprospiraceae bacterium]